MDELQMARFHYFSWLSNIPVCEVCTAHIPTGVGVDL